LRIGVLVFFLWITGCTTVKFLRKDISPVRKAALMYPLPSSSEREKEYRNEFRDQAREFCSGDYYVIREYQERHPTGSAVGLGTGFGIGSHTGVIIGGTQMSSEVFTFVEIGCGATPPANAPQ
jgi:hypothetical protein